MKQFEDLANLLINPSGSNPIYNCLLHINHPEKNVLYSRAFGHMEADHGLVKSNFLFRSGSITKTFTAVLIFQLMEDGMLHLGDNYLDLFKDLETRNFFSNLLFVDDINFSGKITVKSLLLHQSGIRDYFTDDERFIRSIMNNPKQNWDWKRVMKSYYRYNLNRRGLFKPDEGFYYSDTNYLLLAVLIEELTNMPYHEVLEQKILGPLSLNETYLEFFQDPKGSKPIVFPYYGTYSLKNVNTSFDWGGGGLLTSFNDLDIFMRSLFEGQLFENVETLQKIINIEGNINNKDSKKHKISHGMGLQQKKIGRQKFVGHNSAYGGMMFYNLETKLSLIFTINQALAPQKAEWFMNKLVEYFI
jgi:D-alanyl-D-alanine carboxypeptidase